MRGVVAVAAVVVLLVGGCSDDGGGVGDGSASGSEQGDG